METEEYKSLCIIVADPTQRFLLREKHCEVCAFNVTCKVEYQYVPYCKGTLRFETTFGN